MATVCLSQRLQLSQQVFSDTLDGSITRKRKERAVHIRQTVQPTTCRQRIPGIKANPILLIPQNTPQRRKFLSHSRHMIIAVVVIPKATVPGIVILLKVKPVAIFRLKKEVKAVKSKRCSKPLSANTAAAFYLSTAQTGTLVRKQRKH